MNDEKDVNPLIPFGVGVAVGGLGLWLLVQAWPLLFIGGGAALVLKGMQTPKKSETEE